LRDAPFGGGIDTFPALTYGAIFLYRYLLKRSGREPPPNLVAALPEDFVTRTWDEKSGKSRPFAASERLDGSRLDTFCAQPVRRV
jgi:hypothetical protein